MGENTFSYENYKDGIIITDISLELKCETLELPPCIDGKRVIALGPNFIHNLKCDKEYIEIIAYDGLREICDNAFSKTLLGELDLPETVESIGDFAFEDCNVLNILDLPESIISIGQGCFMGSAIFDLRGESSNIDEISSFCFACCKVLQFITLPKSLRIIREKAFFGCKKLDEISIPSGTEIIEPDAFVNCISLRYIRIPSSVMRIGNNIDDNIFICDGSKNESLVIHCEKNSYAQKYAESNGISYKLVPRKGVYASGTE